MLHAQNNNSCQTAAILNPVSKCNSPQTFVFGNGQTEQWFSFNTGCSQFFILEYAIHSSYYKYSVDLFSGIVLGKTSDKRQIDIDAKNLPFGLYTIRLRTGDIIYNSKLLISN